MDNTWAINDQNCCGQSIVYRCYKWFFIDSLIIHTYWLPIDYRVYLLEIWAFFFIVTDFLKSFLDWFVTVVINKEELYIQL